MNVIVHGACSGFQDCFIVLLSNNCYYPQESSSQREGSVLTCSEANTFVVVLEVSQPRWRRVKR